MTEQRARELLAALELWANSSIMMDDGVEKSARLMGLVYGGDVEMAMNATRAALSTPFAESAKSPSDSVSEALEQAFDLIGRTVKHMGDDLVFCVGSLPLEERQRFYALRDDLRSALPEVGSALDGHDAALQSSEADNG